MVDAMQEKGIDMGFLSTTSLQAALEAEQPQTIVTMGCGERCPAVPDIQYLDWEVPDPSGRGPDEMRRIRDEIEAKVLAFIDNL